MNIEIKKPTKMAVNIPLKIISFSLWPLCLVPTMENRRSNASKDSLKVIVAEVISSITIVLSSRMNLSNRHPSVKRISLRK